MSKKELLNFDACIHTRSCTNCFWTLVLRCFGVEYFFKSNCRHQFVMLLHLVIHAIQILKPSTKYTVHQFCKKNFFFYNWICCLKDFFWLSFQRWGVINSFHEERKFGILAFDHRGAFLLSTEIWVFKILVFTWKFWSFESKLFYLIILIVNFPPLVIGCNNLTIWLFIKEYVVVLGNSINHAKKKNSEIWYFKVHS